MIISKRKGFTLVEILLVLAAGSLMFFFGYNAVSHFKERLVLDFSAKELLIRTLDCQSTAVSSGLSSRIECYPSNEAQANLYLEKNGIKQLVHAFSLARGISVNRKDIEFSPSGFPKPPYFGTITLTSKAGFIRKIVVSSVGRIRLE